MSAEKSRIRSFQVTVVPLASSGRPIEKHRVIVQKFGNTSILVEAVAIAANIDPENSVLAEIFKCKLYKFFEEKDRLEDICRDDDLVLYELEDGPSFRKAASQRWGNGTDVQADDIVIVKETFFSSSTGETMLIEGTYGYVSMVDDDGDAKIHFDEPGYDEPQWVFKANLHLLKVDLAVNADKQKLDPYDDEVYNLRRYMDMYVETEKNVKYLREYWNEEMTSLEGSEEEENTPPEVCGVVVTFREAADGDTKAVNFGLPLVLCTKRETSVSNLTKEVGAELKRHGMPDEPENWKFMRTHFGSNWNTFVALSEGAEADETEDSIRFCERQYLVLEWTGEATPALDTYCRGGIVDLCGEEEPEEEVSLETCFKWMTSSEQLSEDDCVYCQRCKELRQSFKQVDIWSAPAVLVLQLKRFEFTGVERHRINTKVQFPLEGLDLRDFCLSDKPSLSKGDCLRTGQRVEIQGLESSLGQKLNGSQGTIEYMDSATGSARWCVQLADLPEVLTSVPPANLTPITEPEAKRKSLPPVFDLVAMSEHIGGASSGHYVAYARSSQTGVWHLFDDGEVSEVHPDEVAMEQQGAYVLFYQRRDCRPDGWGDPEPGGPV